MSDQILDSLGKMITQNGENLKVLNKDKSLMIVFLRHFGCLFCMEAMRDIANRRKEIENRNIRICFVHMAENEHAESYFREYSLPNVDHVSDPNCIFYESFGLLKANFNQLFGLKVWLRSAELAIKDIGALRRKRVGDGFQMPGVFLICKDQVIEKYVHTSVSDRPDYGALSQRCSC